MTVVFKDFKKDVHRIDAIPIDKLETKVGSDLDGDIFSVFGTRELLECWPSHLGQGFPPWSWEKRATQSRTSTAAPIAPMQLSPIELETRRLEQFFVI